MSELMDRLKAGLAEMLVVDGVGQTVGEVGASTDDRMMELVAECDHVYWLLKGEWVKVCKGADVDDSGHAEMARIGKRLHEAAGAVENHAADAEADGDEDDYWDSSMAMEDERCVVLALNSVVPTWLKLESIEMPGSGSVLWVWVDKRRVSVDALVEGLGG